MSSSMLGIVRPGEMDGSFAELEQWATAPKKETASAEGCSQVLQTIVAGDFSWKSGTGCVLLAPVAPDQKTSNKAGGTRGHRILSLFACVHQEVSHLGQSVRQAHGCCVWLGSRSGS